MTSVTATATAGDGASPAQLHSVLSALEVLDCFMTSDELGVPSAAKEAYAFAVLGFLTAHGLPGTIPSCTGARHSSVLGTLTPGRDGLPRCQPGTVPPTRLHISAP